MLNSTMIVMMFEFFKTGLFAMGGGLATLPFLYEISARHPDWFTPSQLADLLAVSESTPGPIGINMSSYVGFLTNGLLGSILATLAIVTPSVIVIIIISKFMEKYKNSKTLEAAMEGLRPAVAGLITSVCLNVFSISAIKDGHLQPIQTVMFVLVLAATQIKALKKIHPIFYIIIGAVFGLVLNL